MARTNRMQTGTQNPAKYFFQWKSKHEKFAYYDKEKSETIFIDFPFKFLALSKYITVKGWNQRKEQAVISNEVKNISDQLIVNAYPKNGDKFEIIRGEWKDIKEKMEIEKGKFTQSVYVMLSNGDVANIELNGASLSTWFEFQKNQTDKFFDNWVVVNGFKEGKSGDVEYTYPVFEWGSTLNKDEQGLAEYADGKIEEYEQSYFGASELKENFRERSEVDKYEMNSQLPPTPPVEEDAKLAVAGGVDPVDEDDLPF